MNPNQASLQSVSPGNTAFEINQVKIDLAACFRMIADQGWSESAANHFSATVSEDGSQFIMNPKWRHFSLIKASELQLFDSNDSGVMSRDDAPDTSAWCIHSRIHRLLPGAKALLHCHPPYATTLATLKDPSIKPIDQNTAKFYNRVAIDLAFDGMADNEDEGQRIAEVMADKKIMMMGNHGVSVVGETIQEAFEDMYYLERACRTMVMAYQTGQPLNVMTDGVAEKTAQAWDRVRDMAYAHFEQYKQLLDRNDPSYAD